MGSKGPKRAVSDSELVETIRSLISSENPVVTTGEIEQELPIGRRSVQKLLRQLEDDDLVLRKEVGPASVWWLPRAVGISDVDVPGRDPEVQQARQEAVEAVYEELKRRRRAPVKQLMQIGWEASLKTYDSPRSLWNNAVRPALKQLSDVEQVERGKWSYTGGEFWSREER